MSRLCSEIDERVQTLLQRPTEGDWPYLWLDRRVHFMRNARAYTGKTRRRVVSAWIGTACAQDDADTARKH